MHAFGTYSEVRIFLQVLCTKTAEYERSPSPKMEHTNTRLLPHHLCLFLSNSLREYANICNAEFAPSRTRKIIPILQPIIDGSYQTIGFIFVAFRSIWDLRG